MKKILTFMVFLISISAAAHADVVYFKQGGTIMGRILSEDDGGPVAIRLLGGGEITVNRNMVQDMVREEDWAFHIRTGDYYKSRGNVQRALTEYRKAVALAPANEVIQRRIKALETEKQLAACREGLERADRLTKQENYWQAIEQYETLLDISPTDEMRETIRIATAQAYAELGNLYYNHIYEKGAREVLEKAEQLDPQNGLVYYVRGRMLRDEGKLQEALRAFSTSMNMDSSQAMAQNYLLDTRKEIERRRTNPYSPIAVP